MRFSEPLLARELAKSLFNMVVETSRLGRKTCHKPTPRDKSGDQ
jgi:hypothetical protein